MLRRQILAGGCSSVKLFSPAHGGRNSFSRLGSPKAVKCLDDKTVQHAWNVGGWNSQRKPANVTLRFHRYRGPSCSLEYSSHSTNSRGAIAFSSAFHFVDAFLAYFKFRFLISLVVILGYMLVKCSLSSDVPEHTCTCRFFFLLTLQAGSSN